MIYLELFWSFFQVGLFSIGGGYAAMPLIQDQVVDIHPWLTMTGFADIMAIAEMTPGPIALNAATFVGIQVAGLPGALIATIGCLFPSCVIVMTLAYIVFRCVGVAQCKGLFFLHHCCKTHSLCRTFSPRHPESRCSMYYPRRRVKNARACQARAL